MPLVIRQVPLQTPTWRVKAGLLFIQIFVRNNVVRKFRKLVKHQKSTLPLFMSIRETMDKMLVSSVTHNRATLPNPFRESLRVTPDLDLTHAVNESLLKWNDSMNSARPLVSTVFSHGNPATHPSAILYVHGGAFFSGSPVTHAGICLHLSAATQGLPVFALDYPLAPEFKFPAALEAGIAAYDHLLSRGYQSIAIAGDSAGGNLALAISNSVNRRPACVAAIAPWTDLCMTGDSIQTHADLDPLIPAEMMHESALLYADSKEELVKASPLYWDDKTFESFPPVLFQIGENEVLYEDTMRMARKIADADPSNHVEVEVWMKLFHVFQLSVGGLPEADKAVNDIGKFFMKHL